MRVVAEEAFTFFYNHAPVTVAEGDTIESDIAVFLLRSGCAVRPDDDEAEQVLAEAGRPDPGDDAAQPAPDDNVDPDAVPDGTIEVILEWVGDDADRARAARDAETADGGKNRPRLLARLDALTD